MRYPGTQDILIGFPTRRRRPASCTRSGASRIRQLERGRATALKLVNTAPSAEAALVELEASNKGNGGAGTAAMLRGARDALRLPRCRRGNACPQSSARVFRAVSAMRSQVKDSET